ncbi:histidine phosphatase family protein [Terasakiella sp.]|uniref:histidine phosphatase family protein n=1 Tax=Terasakiella sp. TaxID=2034861 RepID=UPI003AA935DC
MTKPVAILLRHGDYHQLEDTPSALQPFPLNEQGFLQAQDAVGLLKGFAERHNWQFDPIIECSNQLRSWQTADVICEALDCFRDIKSNDHLSERQLGSAANLTVKVIEQVLNVDPRFENPPADWKSNSHYRLPLQGAESLMEAGERVANHIKHTLHHLPSNTSDQPIAKLFVGHGAAFRHAAHILGILAFEDIAKLSMYHAKPVALSYDEDGTWFHVCGEWKVRHLKEEYSD